ncbi:MAG: right-handed parallel beta-helix repeat-containing protein [Deltaproteobacteria bacterium]|nr:right-handed parallel beta-helix repeat-containing protein [Candidatus Anaeroferrophillacea bacterium]
MKTRSAHVLSIMLIWLLILPCAGWAANHFVTPGGSDAAAGNQLHPWLTLQHAADSVGAGDTVSIAAGTYVGFRTTSGGNGTAPITFQADGSGPVQVTAPSTRCRHGSIIEIEEADYWVLDGLEVSGAPTNAGIDVRVANFVTVRNCYAHHNRNWGIFTAFAESFTALGNECSYSAEEHGIYHSNSGDNAVLQGNTCHHNAGAGIQINADPSMGGDGICSNARVIGNILYENGSAGGAAINLASVRDSVIANNLIYANHAGGIAAWDDDQGEEWGSRNNVYAFNTVHMPADGRWALNLGHGSSGCTVVNNILLHESTARGGLEIDSSSRAGLNSNNNLLAPVSVDEEVLALAEWQGRYGQDARSFGAAAASTFIAPGSDYRLAAGAPAVDGGVAVAGIDVDLAGNARSVGARPDMGVYELAAGVDPVPPTPGDQSACDGGVRNVVPTAPVWGTLGEDVIAPAVRTLEVVSCEQIVVNPDVEVRPEDAGKPAELLLYLFLPNLGSGFMLPGRHLDALRAASFSLDILTEPVPMDGLDGWNIDVYYGYAVGAVIRYSAYRIAVVDAAPPDTDLATGTITYTLGDDVFRVAAKGGATPENISTALDTLSARPAGSRDDQLNISPDGNAAEMVPTGADVWDTGIGCGRYTACAAMLSRGC